MCKGLQVISSPFLYGLTEVIMRRKKEPYRVLFSRHINSKENHEMLLQIFIRGKILKKLNIHSFLHICNI